MYIMPVDDFNFELQDNGRFLTILDINADPDGLRNLDKYILLTLFECKYEFIHINVKQEVSQKRVEMQLKT